MLDGRLFQIAAAAERRPRAPNEMLRVTDRGWQRQTVEFCIHGVCHWTRLARYGGYRYWVVVAILNLINVNVL